MRYPDPAAAAPSVEEAAVFRLDLPQDCEVAVAMLSEVVRSTKRIVSGAAAFQLEAGRKTPHRAIPQPRRMGCLY